MGGDGRGRMREKMKREGGYEIRWESVMKFGVG